MPISPVLKPEPLAREQMRHFLYEFDIRVDTVPKRIDPALVETFLREEIRKGRPTPGPAQRLVELADYYDLRGLVPELIRWLDRREASDRDYVTSLALNRAVGILGDDRQRAFAREYYRHLLALKFAENRVPELLDALAVLVPEEPIEPTRQRIQEIIDAFNAQAPNDPTAGLQARELEDLRNVTLARISAAASRKAEILARDDLKTRHDELVAIYLGLDMRYFEYLERWSARILLRDARAGEAPALIAAFRRALETIAAGNEPDEARAARRAKALHALEFLGDTLTPDEQADMAPPEVKERDLLSIEG